MRVIFVNGRSLHLTYREMLKIFQHPLSVGLMICALILFISLKPHAVVVPALPFYQMMILWANSVVGFFAIYLGASLWAERRGLALWTAFLLLPISLYQTLGGGVLVILLGHPPVPAHVLAQLVVFHFVLLALIEVVFTAFILPRVLSDPGNPFSAAATSGFADTGAYAPPEMTVLLGQRFRLDELLSISAQEHYVQIVTVSGQHLLRGRISDIEAQLAPDLGLRIHRSHWVAARAVAALQRGASWSVRLLDGSELPVARARREAARAWVAALGKPIH